MNEQTMIGWKNMELGVVTKEFRYTQQRFLQERGKTKSEAINLSKRWAKGLQKELWEYVWGQWQHRNHTIQGGSRAAQQLIRRQGQLREALTVVRSKPRLLAEDMGLLISEDALTAKSHHLLKTWLRSVKIARQKYEYLQAKREREKG